MQYEDVEDLKNHLQALSALEVALAEARLAIRKVKALAEEHLDDVAPNFIKQVDAGYNALPEHVFEKRGQT